MNARWHILVVEDDVDDTFFMRRALRRAAPDAVVDYVADGQAALDYLRATGSFASRAGAALPDILFLDLKLPYVYGLDVLANVRSTPHLAPLRVAILTSSSEERDRVTAERLGIEAYLVKPPTATMLAEVLARLPAARRQPAAAPAGADPHPRASALA